MPVQDTIDAADMVVSELNGAGLTVGGIFGRTFFPSFDPDDMGGDPSGQVFPAGLGLARASRRTDEEELTVEVGLGRVLSDENADTAAQLRDVEEINAALRGAEDWELPDSGEEVQFLRLESTLFVPDLLRKSVALSVVTITFRHWV